MLDINILQITKCGSATSSKHNVNDAQLGGYSACSQNLNVTEFDKIHPQTVNSAAFAALIIVSIMN